MCNDRLSWTPIFHLIGQCLTLLFLLSSCRGAEVSFDKVLDSPMYHLPKVPRPRVEYRLPTGTKELWLRVLQRPDADTKCQAAQAIARAYRDGFKDFETTIPALLEVFDQPNQHPTVRVVVAETLIALNAREAAASLFRQAQSGDSDLRECVEPALARWDHRPAREVWLARLREPTTSLRNLALAIRCLGEVRDDKAVEPLRAMVLAENLSGPIRLQAARALAGIRTAGLEKDAERLFDDQSRRGLARRLAAVSLLRQHDGADAVALLQRMARDPEPSVAIPAVTRLLEIDPQLLAMWVDHFLDDSKAARFRDAHLRLLAVQVLHRLPSSEHLHKLVVRLDDEHSGVRVAAREALRQLAGDNKRRKQMIEETLGLLKTKEWRQLEQATILLVQLDHKPAAGLLVKLLPFERPEVSIAAAWGLRKLAVSDTLPDVAKYVESQWKRVVSAQEPDDKTEGMLLSVGDHQLSQLNQLLGQQKYRPAEPLLRLFLPKPEQPPMSVECRSAAIWALGLIHEGGAPDAVVTAVEDSLNHDRPRFMGDRPEPVSLREIAAISLGQWKAKKAVPSLETHYEEQRLDMWACRLALEQITGKAMPPLAPIRKIRSDWFLAPNRDEAASKPSTSAPSR